VTHFKPLTQSHVDYAKAIGIPVFQSTDTMALQQHWQTLAPRIDWWLDGLFGFGLERPITGHYAQLIQLLNDHPAPIVSLDLPSGLHTDDGIPLGIAVRATHTFCLGLWKRGLWQDSSLPYTGTCHRIDLDIPNPALNVLSPHTPIPEALTLETIQRGLPLPIPRHTHKYQRGQVLIIAGSRQYRGAAILAALGARASGVGLVTLAVPALPMTASLPDVLMLDCPPDDNGAIAALPEGIAWERFQCVVCGPGLTVPAAQTLLPSLLRQLPTACPIVLDADALNALALTLSAENPIHHPVILTPHTGEFRRLFPALATLPPLDQATAAVQHLGTHAILVLKGFHTLIATQGIPKGALWVNRHSTPALARAGSGDVLAGLMGGLIAARHPQVSILEAVKAAVYWHSYTGRWLEQHRTPLGVDATHLAENLNLALADLLQK
jgi:NAD(P)H-hydrate epimerase